MNKTELIDNLILRLSDLMDIDKSEIDPNKPLSEYNLDELDYLEYIIILEREYNIEIHDQFIESSMTSDMIITSTINDLSELIIKQL